MSQFEKRFWYFAGSQFITNLSDGITIITLTLLTLSISDAPLHLGFVMSALSAPWFILSVFSGIVIDRHGAYIIAKKANCIRSVLFFVFSIVILFNKANIPLLVIFSFMVGTLEVLCDNSHSIFLPRIVKKEDIEKANSIVSTAELASNKFIGVNIGSIISKMSGALSLIITSALYLCSFICLNFSEKVSKDSRYADAYTYSPVDSKMTFKSFKENISFGIKYILTHNGIGLFVLIGIVFNFTMGMQLSFYILYIVNTLGFSQQTYSFLISFSGIGALLGGALIYLFLNKYGRFKVLVASSLLVLLQFVLKYAAVSLLSLIVASVLEGFTIIVINTISMSYRQRMIEQKCIGKVMSSTRFLIVGATSLGSFVGGYVAEVVSYNELGMLIGIFTFIVALICSLRLKSYVDNLDT